MKNYCCQYFNKNDFDINIKNHLFNSHLFGGYSTVALYGKNRIEETFEDKITYTLKNLITEAESSITQQILNLWKQRSLQAILFPTNLKT